MRTKVGQLFTEGKFPDLSKCKVTEHLPVYSCCVSPARSLLLASSTRAREHVFA
jgi:hypothetical protein